MSIQGDASLAAHAGTVGLKRFDEDFDVCLIT